MTIVSIDWAKALTHYHLPSDRPENVDLGTVRRAAELAEAVLRDLAARR